MKEASGKYLGIRNNPRKANFPIEYIDKVQWGEERSILLRKIREEQEISRAKLANAILENLELIGAPKKDSSFININFVRTLERGLMKEGISPFVAIALSNALDVDLNLFY